MQTEAMYQFPETFTQATLADHVKKVITMRATEEAAQIRQAIVGITTLDFFFQDGGRASLKTPFLNRGDVAKKLVLLEMMQRFPNCLTVVNCGVREKIEKVPKYWRFEDLIFDLKAKISLEGPTPDGKFVPV